MAVGAFSQWVIRERLHDLHLFAAVCAPVVISGHLVLRDRSVLPPAVGPRVTTWVAAGLVDATRLLRWLYHPTVAPVPSALVVLVAYLIGTFPSAQLAGRWRGVDPLRSGSRNPGTTNVLRTAGPRAAVLTLVGDVTKGAIPAAAGWALGGHTLGVLCGVAAVVGHVLPVTRRFKGGKGVATAMGMGAVVFPVAAFIGLAGFALAFLLTRIASVGSLLGGTLAVVVAGVIGTPGVEMGALIACVGLIVVRHAENLRRLVRGREPRTDLGQLSTHGGRQ